MYKPVEDRKVRDYTKVSEVASDRPILATRIQSEVEDDTDSATMHRGDDPCARMNEALNSNRGGGRG